MSDDVTPAEAVRRVDDGDGSGSAPDARSDPAADATASHEAAEGATSTGRFGSRGALQDALLSTDPGTPLRAVDSPWNPEEGGITRVYRGLQKMLDFAGTPAIVDVVVGVAEFVHAFEPDGGSDDDSDGQPADDERDVPDLADVGDSEEGMAV